MVRNQHARHSCLDQRIEQNRCTEHGDECPDQVVRWYGDGEITHNNQYGLPIHPDAGGGYIQIDFCPFCGAALAPTDTPTGQAAAVAWKPSAIYETDDGALATEITADGNVYDLIAHSDGGWSLFQGSVFLSGEELTQARAQQRLLKIAEALTVPLA